MFYACYRKLDERNELKTGTPFTRNTVSSKSDSPIFSLSLSVSLSQIIDYIHKYIKGCLVVLIDTWEFFIIKKTLSLLIVFWFFMIKTSQVDSNVC